MSNPSIDQPRATNGQWTTPGHPENLDVDLTDDGEDEDTCECGESLADGEGYDGKCGSCADRAFSADEVVAQFPTTGFDLAFVEYDDKLTDDQINDVLAGDWTSVENAVDDVFADSREANTLEAAESAAADAEYEWFDLSETVRETILDEVRTRDVSDPVADLLRHTPKQLLRTCLGQPGVLAGVSRQDDFDEDHTNAARRAAVDHLLRGAGLDTSSPGAFAAIAALVNETGGQWHEGVDLDVIWYGDVPTSTSTPRANTDQIGSKTLTFTNPTILLIDRVNGSGFEVTVPGELRKHLTRNTDEADLDRTEKVYLDSASGGYGWDSIAGVVKSAYETPVSSTWS